MTHEMKFNFLEGHAVLFISNKEVKVDYDDLNLLSGFKWYCGGSRPYAITPIKVNGKRKYLTMTRILLNPPSGYVVDHVNGDIFDNRKCNLRICTYSENMKNRSSCGSKTGFKGVYKAKKKFLASVRSDGKNYYLGLFKTPELAAEAYKVAAKKLHGEFYRD